MLIAGLLFACMNICVKLVSHLPTMEVVFFRSVLGLILTYALLKRKQIPLFGNNKVLLSLRGVAGCLGLVGSFYTLQHIPLASAVTINYLSPFFTAVLGIFIARQPLRPQQYLYFIMAIAGVALLKGFDTSISTFDLLIGLSAALFAGIAYNIISKLKTSEHPLVIIFYFPMITFPVAGIYSYFHWVNPTGLDWVILLLVGIFTQGAQYYMTRSYQQANLGRVASLNYLGVIYAILFGYLVFGEQLGLYALLGIVLILVAVVLNLRVRAS
ncbi:EamA domain-containing membrane protein RarD [Sphingobacterium allocomposti]|uniref:EamA domain-containing membrane protein RarD n=2 Tax=Sphingobacterium allocomposti TaxID=415956 RepID=A0A5S5D0S9_9SPHI|nr:EamA domain-containing membrane protein RarD [Sphingobacterium composti Yoo et al. 2007 non Ten et al. 2007]